MICHVDLAWPPSTRSWQLWKGGLNTLRPEWQKEKHWLRPWKVESIPEQPFHSLSRIFKNCADSTFLFWDHVDHFYILYCWVFVVFSHYAFVRSLWVSPGCQKLMFQNKNNPHTYLFVNICCSSNCEIDFNTTHWWSLLYTVSLLHQICERKTFLCAKLNKLLCSHLCKAPTCTLMLGDVSGFKYCNKWIITTLFHTLQLFLTKIICIALSDTSMKVFPI